jgi:hypothetical protein
MIKTRLVSLIVALGLIPSFTLSALAADHTDSPAVQSDAAADINDFYVFASTDSGDPANNPRTVFVMTVFPFADSSASFSDAVDYEFIAVNLDDGATFVITCGLVEGQMQCTSSDGGTALVAEAGTDDVLRFRAEPMIMYSGLRDDPFFFDLVDFLNVYESGDPTVLLDDTGSDTFAGAGVLAIVVDVHNTALPGSNLAVWARTVRR